MCIESYIHRFQSLRVNAHQGGFSPHKPCMLLAVLEVAGAGGLVENRIVFSPPLLERYRRLFEVVRTSSDHPNPYFPFFHLRGDGFWHLKSFPGREAEAAAMRTARSHADVEQNFAYAYLDDDLHRLIINPIPREELRSALLSRWFPQYREALAPVLAEESRAGAYERQLRGLLEGRDIRDEIEVCDKVARSNAFRRTVIEAYDYRCAASGWRIILPDGQVMVEAAHLIPFSVSGDDDPRNGIALAPSYHWALDHNVISPGPDLRWHVSESLDPRLPDNKALLDLEGESLLFPANGKFRPRGDALEYRFRQLSKFE